MNLHRSEAGKGWVSHRNAAPRFQWLCLVALQWLRRVKHAHLLEMIQLREQGTKWQQRWKKGNVSNPGSLRAVFLHVPAHSVRAFVHLSALSCLLSPPGLPTVLAASSPIPAVRTAFLTRQPQLSGATC